MTKTILGKVGLTPKGEWKAGTYRRLDLVSFGGGSYASMVNDNTSEPTDAEKWMPVAKQGEKGEKLAFADLSAEDKAELKGEKGDALTYDQLTPEQKKELKAHSPELRDGTWWEWDDETGDYVNTGISASSAYELTKGKVEAVLTDDITTHNHATQLAAALVNYVQKVSGKDLSTNDFTNALKQKLEGLQNYDDAAVQAAISTINTRIDTLLGTSASEAIDTFHEIEAFLTGITDTETLTGLLADLKTEIQALIPTKLSQLQNDNNMVQDAAYVHTDNNYTAEEKQKLAGLRNYDDTYIRGLITGLQGSIPTKLSQLQNDDSTVKDAAYVHTDNNYTAEEKQKLAGLRNYDDTDIRGLITGLQGSIPTKLSQLQNDDSTVKDAAYVHTDNNYTAEEKQKVADSLRLKEYADVSDLSKLPATPYNLRYAYTSGTAKAIAFADASAVPEMQEFYLSIKNGTSATITQPIPNGSGWQSDEESIDIEAGKTAGVSIKKEHGTLVVRV